MNKKFIILKTRKQKKDEPQKFSSKNYIMKFKREFVGLKTKKGDSEMNFAQRNNFEIRDSDKLKLLSAYAISRTKR